MTEPLDRVIGQSIAITLLKSAMHHHRIAPAYLFFGPEGIGKALTARSFVEQLMQRSLINHPDVLWVEPTYQDKNKLISVSEAATSGIQIKGKPQIRVEQIRSIGEFLAHPPLVAPRSVVVLEEAQTMAEAPANALLKTLEEPGKATVILLVPAISAVLATLVSRCQRIPFYRLSSAQVCQILHELEYQELPDWLINFSQGSPGYAIKAWQIYQEIPADLLELWRQFPLPPVRILSLAKQVSQELDLVKQLWLLDYWQSALWHNNHNRSMLLHLENAKQWLIGYVQPRLVWEVNLFQLSASSLWR